MMPQIVWSLIAVTILSVAVIFSPTGGDWLWLRSMHDFAHGPIFGCVALLVLFSLRARPSQTAFASYIGAFVSAVLLGGLTEVLQLFSNRDPSWADLRMDALGATTFLLVAASFDPLVSARINRLVFVLAAAAAVTVLLSPLMWTALEYSKRAESFPLIVDFSRDIGAEFWTTRQVNTRIELLPERFSNSNERAMLVEFLPGRWQGLDLREPPRDWRGYAYLILDVANPTREDLKIVLRIDDRGYNGPYIDRYNGHFEVSAFTRSAIRIPISDIEFAPRGRVFNLANITRVLLFREHESKAERMYVVQMKLEGKRAVTRGAGEDVSKSE